MTIKYFQISIIQSAISKIKLTDPLRNEIAFFPPQDRRKEDNTELLR